jgi:uncharacterized protein GlcG (DUF336 family)
MEISTCYWAGGCETAFGGGIPVYEEENGSVPVGALGVSGGTQEQDHDMALIGLKALGLVTH